MEQIIIYGAGNSGIKALETLRRQGKYECIGFIDDQVSIETNIQGIPVLGPRKVCEKVHSEGIRKAFVANGNNYQRKMLAELLKRIDFELVSIIDPNSFVSYEARIGAGVLLMSGVYVGHKTTIDDLVVCQTNTVISHCVGIGEAVNLSYSSVVSAYATIGRFCRICIGAKVLNNVSVGEASLVGAGAVVTKPIPAGVLAYGVPAKVVRAIDLTRYDPNKKMC